MRSEIGDCKTARKAPQNSMESCKEFLLQIVGQPPTSGSHHQWFDQDSNGEHYFLRKQVQSREIARHLYQQPQSSIIALLTSTQFNTMQRSQWKYLNGAMWNAMLSAPWYTIVIVVQGFTGSLIIIIVPGLWAPLCLFGIDGVSQLGSSGRWQRISASSQSTCGNCQYQRILYHRHGGELYEENKKLHTVSHKLDNFLRAQHPEQLRTMGKMSIFKEMADSPDMESGGSHQCSTKTLEATAHTGNMLMPLYKLAYVNPNDDLLAESERKQR